MKIYFLICIVCANQALMAMEYQKLEERVILLKCEHNKRYGTENQLVRKNMFHTLCTRYCRCDQDFYDTNEHNDVHLQKSPHTGTIIVVLIGGLIMAVLLTSGMVILKKLVQIAQRNSTRI